MKTMLCTFILGLFIMCGLYAQSPTAFVVKPGDNIMWSVPFAERYEYPAFKQGIVYFKNKTTGGGQMNYNYMSQEMFFIDGKGDTLALADPLQVDSVLFGADIFYYSSEGFVKLDTTAGDIRICQGKFFYVINKQVTGAYGQPTDANGNNRYTKFSSSLASANITAQDIITLGVRKSLYAGRRFQKLEPVTKKSLNNIFRKNDQAIKQYLLTNTVDYSNRESILKLVLWMNAM